MLMAGIHVQMTAVRCRDDINIASLFPAPTPITHFSLCLQYAGGSLSNGPPLTEGKLWICWGMKRCFLLTSL